MEYLVGELALNNQELAQEFQIWRRWTTSRTPPFFPGFLEVLGEYHDQGGKVAVISHSERDVIESHYRNSSGSPVPSRPRIRLGP